MRILAFGYDFPHRRSVDHLLRMCMAGFRPDLYVGAPWRELPHRRSALRVDHAPIDLLAASDVCRWLDIGYLAMAHDAPELAPTIGGRFDLGVITSARILRAPVISAFPRGVLNVHAGLIPENRGLDHVQNAIARDIPMGVTSHLIDVRVDAGVVIDRYLVPVFAGDELIDIGLRVMEALNLVLVPALERIQRGDPCTRTVATPRSGVNTPGDPGVDETARRRWSAYVERWAVDLVGWRCVCGTPIREGACQGCGRRYEPFGPLLRELAPSDTRTVSSS